MQARAKPRPYGTALRKTAQSGWLSSRGLPVTDLRQLTLSVFALLLLLPAPVLPQGAEDDRIENVYLSGTEVRPPGAVTGDLVAAAGRITVEHAVRGDATLAAGST